MAYLNMDLSDVKPGMGFDSIPAGEYQAHIVGSELRSTQKGEMQLSFTWMILDGEYSGHRIFDSLMMTGKGIDFGKRKLRTILDVIDYPTPNGHDIETENMHGIPCVIVVGFGKGDYAEKNEIKNYKPLEQPRQSESSPAAPQSPPPRQSPPAQRGNTPPPPRKPSAPTPFDEPAPDGTDAPF